MNTGSPRRMTGLGRAKSVGATPLSEFERIEQIRKMFVRTAGHRIKVGIGDDAAVLRPGKGDLVWTVDSSVEDVHFRFGWLSAEDIGWRSFHAAVSDLAAMGAMPVAALSALELPKGFAEVRLKGILQGQVEASACLRCPIVGGNLASAAAVSITTTVLGHTAQSLLRSGARVGDELWLVGTVGLAAAGLACLMEGSRTRRGRAAERCITAWRRPEALIARGRALIGRAHAVIDISDGLVGDAEHVAASSQVAIEVDFPTLTELLCPDLQRVAKALCRPAIDFALYGGEDYALLAAGPQSQRPRWAHPIGRIGIGTGVWGISRDGSRRRLRRGFDHFRG